jgi:hypothetical protein
MLINLGTHVAAERFVDAARQPGGFAGSLAGRAGAITNVIDENCL